MTHDIDPCTGNCLICCARHEEFDDNLADPKVCYGKEAHERRLAAWSMLMERRNARWRNGEVLPETCSDAEILRCEDEIAGFVPFPKAVPPERVLAPFPIAAYRVLTG